MTDRRDDEQQSPEARTRNATGDSLRDYLRRIGRIPVLTAEEEQDLARRIAQGDQAAFHKLVESNLRFVVKVAMKYRDADIGLLDLINEGNTGLIEATRRFDPDRGTRFITYAVWWIRQAIIQALIAHSNPVRLPSKQARAASRIYNARQHFHGEHGRDPTERELHEEYDIDTRNIEDIMRASRGWLSLEAPMGEDDDKTLMDSLEGDADQSTEAVYIHRRIAEEVQDLLGQLDEREARIIDLRFGISDGVPRTLEDIGAEFELSKERVRQLEERALFRLRKKALARRLLEYLQ